MLQQQFELYQKRNEPAFLKQIEEEQRRLKELEEAEERKKIEDDLDAVNADELEDINAPIVMPFDVFIPRAEFFYDRDRYFFEQLIQVILNIIYNIILILYRNHLKQKVYLEQKM